MHLLASRHAVYTAVSHQLQQFTGLMALQCWAGKWILRAPVAIIIVMSFTNEQNFNIGCFDYSLAVLSGNTHTHSEPVHTYIYTKYVLIYTQNCQKVVEMLYTKVLFTGESLKQLQRYSMNARTMTFSEHSHNNLWSNVASCQYGDFLRAKVLVARQHEDQHRGGESAEVFPHLRKCPLKIHYFANCLHST